MGLTWAVAWVPVGAMVGLVMARLYGGPLATVTEAALLFGASGFVVGAAFSGLLAIADGRRRFHQMSLRRFAAWGALGGLLISPYTIFDGMSISLATVVGVGVVTALSAASAAASLAIARHADDRELPEAGEEAASVGLTGSEAPKLLGGA